MTLTARDYERQLRRARLSEVLPVLAYDDETQVFLLNHQMLARKEQYPYAGFAFCSEPLTGISPTLMQQLNGLLNLDFPVETFMQWLMFASPDVSPLVDAARALRAVRTDQILLGNAPKTVYDTVAQRRIERIERASLEGISEQLPQRAKIYRIFISIKSPIKAAAAEDPVVRSAEINRVAQLRERFSTVLATTGFVAQPLDANGYIHTLQTLLNWQPSAEWRERRDLYDPTMLIRDQVADLDNVLDVDERALMLNGRYVRTLSPKRLPEQADLWHLRRLLGNPDGNSQGANTNLAVGLIIHYPDQMARRAKLEQKSYVNAHQVRVGLGRVVSQIGDLDRSLSVLLQAIKDGDKVVHVYPMVALFCDSAEDANREVANYAQYAKGVGLNLQEDRGVMLASFLNHLPFGADPHPSAMNFLARYKTVATRHAMQLLPILADWRGTGAPALNYFSRSNQPVAIDLFDSPTNFNLLVVASSGGGKSFLINDLITQYASCNVRNWIIDIGRSYEKTTLAYGGDFIAFSRDQHICLNPFPLVEDYEDEEDMLVTIITSMATLKDGLRDIQISKVRELMTDLWHEYGKDLSIDIISTACRANDDERVKDVGAQLFAFTTKGPWGRYFHGTPTLDFSNQITTLELEELKTQPHLLQVVLLVLMYQINYATYVNRGKHRSLLVIDEAWDLLTRGDVSAFMETAYRRFRKYDAAVAIATQNIADLHKTASGKAIVANSAHKVFLEQEADVIKSLGASEEVALDAWSLDALKTIHTAKGLYSEQFWRTPRGQGITRLIVPRFDQILFSTLASETQAVTARLATERGVSAERIRPEEMVAAIDHLVATEKARQRRGVA